jgi:2-amino-4-hydroxy-6-hydroxymethyldihydropteridine diphosphokinase
MIAAIALGSNLGDRQRHLDRAVERLAALLAGLRVSSAYETEPVGMDPGAPPVLYAAAVGEPAVAPRALLRELLAIEAEAGRERPRPNASRSLDLDLILYGDLVLEEAGLTLPHPRFRERRFVLDPLAEIAGGLVDPVTRLTVAQLRARVEEPGTSG